MIKREIYEKQINAVFWKTFIKVLVGQRRVGKSTLLKSIIKKFSNTIVIDKEQKKFDEIYNEEKLYQYLKKNITQKTELIAIDEIQNIQSREKAILSIFNEHQDIEIRITGSNSAMLSSELSTNLRGRYISIHIYPFVYSEYCLYMNTKPWFESMQSYINDGTMPSVYPLLSIPNNNQRRKDIVNSIVLKDIIQRYNIRDIHFIYDIYQFLLNNMGNITSNKSLLSYISSLGKKISINTLQQYLTYLCDAFLVYECLLYNIQGKKVFERLRKYYVSDASMKKIYFWGYDNFFWKNIENIVFMTAKSYGREAYVGRIKDNEVDFILEKDGKKIYLQVAYLLTNEKVIQREYHSLAEITTDTRPKYVVSLDQINFWTKNGIQHIQLWNLEEILQ